MQENTTAEQTEARVAGTAGREKPQHVAPAPVSGARAQPSVPRDSKSFFPQSTAEMPSRRVARFFEEISSKWGAKRLRTLVANKGRVSESMGEIPRNMHRVASQTRLVLELIDDFRDGTYREIPWRKMALLVGAILYAINPADVIPNVIPFVGTMDDLAVVALVTRLLNKDLKAYCKFKGYPLDEYFRP